MYDGGKVDDVACAGGWVVEENMFFHPELQMEMNCGDAAFMCNMDMASCGGSEGFNEFFWHSTECCMKEGYEKPIEEPKPAKKGKNKDEESEDEGAKKGKSKEEDPESSKKTKS